MADLPPPFTPVIVTGIRSDQNEPADHHAYLIPCQGRHVWRSTAGTMENRLDVSHVTGWRPITPPPPRHP